MTRIYSYVLRVDDGAAPNPFWNLCTLAICKPVIRRIATPGDWIIGTGSKRSRFEDGTIRNLSTHIVYAMKVTEIKTFQEYDTFCNQSLPEKIPQWLDIDWRRRAGDCIYDYSQSGTPHIRKGIHNEENRNRDLRGLNVLLSNHFYYFGEETRPLPVELKELIKRNRGHKKIERQDLVTQFEEWIQKFEINRLYALPQMRQIFQKPKTNKTCTEQFVCDKNTREPAC